MKTGLVTVYLDDGRVYEYDVTGFTDAEVAAKCREHCNAIIEGGYRRVPAPCNFEHYPPHRIAKVKARAEGIETKYPDRVSGT